MWLTLCIYIYIPFQAIFRILNNAEYYFIATYFLKFQFIHQIPISIQNYFKFFRIATTHLRAIELFLHFDIQVDVYFERQRLLKITFPNDADYNKIVFTIFTIRKRWYNFKSFWSRINSYEKTLDHSKRTWIS